MDQEDLFNLASLFQHPLRTSPIATRQGHLRRLLRVVVDSLSTNPRCLVIREDLRVSWTSAH